MDPDPSTDNLLARGEAFLAEAVDIWQKGGWAMAAIAAVSLLMFALATHIYLRLRGLGHLSVSEKQWRAWLDRPEEGRGPIGELVADVCRCRTIEQVGARFEEAQKNRSAPIRRDLNLMKVFVSAAPLLGLLGTVIGMLSTFGALSSGSGGDETQGAIAAGISEALITTETGLVVALPGLFIQSALSRKHDAYRAFLSRIESVAAQRVFRRQQAARAAA